MAVYREGYSIIKMIEDNSVQIFDDACDYGAPVKLGDKLCLAAKQLTEWYGVEGSRKEHVYSTGKTVEHKIELMDEWAVSDQRKTEHEAIDIYQLSFITCTKGKCKGFDGYLTIEKFV